MPGLNIVSSLVPPNELSGKVFNGAYAFATVSNQTAITSTTGKMLGAGIIFTPKNSTRILVTFDGGMASSSAGACTAIPSFGTGTAPANAAAFSGTQVGNGAQMTSIAATQIAVFPFSTTVMITGLLIGTAYWLDLDCAAAAGTITITGLNVTIIEV